MISFHFRLKPQLRANDSRGPSECAFLLLINIVMIAILGYKNIRQCHTLTQNVSGLVSYIRKVILAVGIRPSSLRQLFPLPARASCSFAAAVRRCWQQSWRPQCHFSAWDVCLSLMLLLDLSWTLSGNSCYEFILFYVCAWLYEGFCLKHFTRNRPEDGRRGRMPA